MRENIGLQLESFNYVDDVDPLEKLLAESKYTLVDDNRQYTHAIEITVSGHPAIMRPKSKKHEPKSEAAAYIVGTNLDINIPLTVIRKDSEGNECSIQKLLKQYPSSKTYPIKSYGDLLGAFDYLIGFSNRSSDNWVFDGLLWTFGYGSSFDTDFKGEVPKVPIMFQVLLKGYSEFDIRKDIYFLDEDKVNAMLERRLQLLRA